MRKLWLGFAQVATILFAALYLISLFRTEPLPPQGEVVTIKEAPPVTPAAGATTSASYSGAARKAISSVAGRKPQPASVRAWWSARTATS
jgi:hypothetical protein